MLINPADPVIRAAWAHLNEVLSPYFQTMFKFSSELNHLRERRRLAAQNGKASYNLLSESNGEVKEDIKDKAWIVYNRSPIQWIGIGRDLPDQVILPSKDPTQFQVRDFIKAGFTVNAAFTSRDIQQTDVFELVYQTRFRPYARVEFEMQDPGIEKPLLLSFDLVVSALDTIEQSNEQSLGSYWVVPFSIEVTGVFLSPESMNYPRLMKLVSSIDVGNVIRTSNGEVLPDAEYSQRDIVWTQKNLFNKGRVVGTQFSLASSKHIEV